MRTFGLFLTGAVLGWLAWKVSHPPQPKQVRIRACSCRTGEPCAICDGRRFHYE